MAIVTGAFIDLLKPGLRKAMANQHIGDYELLKKKVSPVVLKILFKKIAGCTGPGPMKIFPGLTVYHNLEKDSYTVKFGCHEVELTKEFLLWTPVDPLTGLYENYKKEWLGNFKTDPNAWAVDDFYEKPVKSFKVTFCWTPDLPPEELPPVIDDPEAFGYVG